MFISTTVSLQHVTYNSSQGVIKFVISYAHCTCSSDPNFVHHLMDLIIGDRLGDP